MKKIKSLIITVLIIGFVLFSTSISMAASLTISTSKSEAKEGETVAITVNGNGITGRVNLSATGGTLEDSSVWVENSKATVNLTLNGSGDAKVTATPSDVSDSSTGEAASVSSTGATVKLSKDEPTPPAETDSNNNNNNESNQQNDNEDNNNNNNNDNNSSNSNNNSSNNNQTEKKPTETKKSSNANLNNLGIKPNDFTGFRAGTTSYNVTVPNDVEKVNVYATAADRNAKISGTGDRNLNIGANALNVTVTAEDGTTNTYTINVTREEAKQEEKTENENNENAEKTEQQGDLTKLEIKGLTLNPQFSPTTYSYKLNVKNDVSKLDISTQTRNDKIKVEVVGNENLKEGENIITVLVTNEVTNDNATYQIVVNKEAKSENTQVATNNSISKANKIRKILFILILVFVALIITGFIIYFKNKKNEEDDGIYEYDEEDLDNTENEENNKKIDLNEDEELFKRVNRQKFSVAKEANKMLQDDNKNEMSNRIDTENKNPERIGNIEIKEKKNNSNNMIEEYFRTSKSDKKGKHF